MSPAEAFNTQPGNSQIVILVVDDESGIREFLAAYLQSKDFKVFTAASAEEALQLWGEIHSKVSLLITDIIMPGLNGKLLAEKLKAEKPSLQVIYMSGYLPEEIAEETLGAIFFRKPFHPHELLKAIRAALH
jgi:DNA-binding response OmpR family regulator